MSTVSTTMEQQDIAPGVRPHPDGLEIVDQLLRDRPALLERIESGVGLGGLARTMVVTILMSAGSFGAAIGAYRGGAQILFAAVKWPLVFLLTAAVCAPALTALRHVVQKESNVRRDLALLLSCLALAGLVQAALAPLVLLAASFEVRYHIIILLIVAVCSGSGAVGLSLLSRGLASPQRRGRFLVGGTLLLVCLLVGAQMAWILRPYVVRPRTPEIPFARALEGNFFESVLISFDSARGIYHRSYAPVPELGEEVIR